MLKPYCDSIGIFKCLQKMGVLLGSKLQTISFLTPWQDYLDGSLIAQLEQGCWRLRDRWPCDHCDAVFCSEECYFFGRKPGEKLWGFPMVQSHITWWRFVVKHLRIQLWTVSKHFDNNKKHMFTHANLAVFRLFHGCIGSKVFLASGSDSLGRFANLSQQLLQLSRNVSSLDSNLVYLSNWIFRHISNFKLD